MKAPDVYQLQEIQSKGGSKKYLKGREFNQAKAKVAEDEDESSGEDSGDEEDVQHREE